MSPLARPRIVVVGGGFGGLEAAFALRARLGDRARISIVSESSIFVVKPNTVYLPFGTHLRDLSHPLGPPAARRDIEVHSARVRDIDPAAKVLAIHDDELRYDFAVLATGASPRPQDVPGLALYGVTAGGYSDMLGLRQSFRELYDDARAGRRIRVLFTVPPGSGWSAPLYELAMMLDSSLRRLRLRDAFEIELATHERGFLEPFGPSVHEAVRRELARRGITASANLTLREVLHRKAYFDAGSARDFDLLVAAPPRGASTRFFGLPRDARGYALTDMASRRALGQDGVFVVGDGADFPVKQAVLALAQADAAAEAIVAEIEGRSPRFGFEPVSRLVLDGLDTAMFAETTLHATGSRRHARLANGSQPRVSVSAMWGVGKRFMARYLPWRLDAGRPLHGGVPWRGMEIGMRALASVLS